MTSPIAEAIEAAESDIERIARILSGYGQDDTATELFMIADTLRAAQATAGWQEISSAPKDGKRFLFTNGEMVGTGLYVTPTAFGADSWQGARRTEPTHWQPLPRAPGATT